MGKRKVTSATKPSSTAPAPAAKKARFSNPPPPPPAAAAPAAATPAQHAAPPAKPQGPPKRFVVSVGSYERLLYGLDCSFTPTSPPSLSVNPIFSFPAHLSSLRTVAASTTAAASAGGGRGTMRKVGGKYLVSGGQDEVIKVWDLQRRKEVGSLEGDTTGTITCLRFCPARNMLLSASSDSTISLYRVRDWVLLRSLKGHKGRVNSIDPHPEGRVCLSVGKDKNLRMWDLVAGKSVATLKLGLEGDVVRWNATGTKFGVITANTLTVYGIDMSIHHTLTAPSRFHDLQFCILPSDAASKEFLLVACEDGKVRVFDISNPKPVKVGQEEDEQEFEEREKMEVCAELTGHSNRVKMMDLLEVALPSTTESAEPASTVILTTASSDGRINLYDLSLLASTTSTTTKGKGKGKAKTTTVVNKLELEPSATFDTDKSRLTSICAIGLLEKRGVATGAGTATSGAGDEGDSDDDDEEEEEEDDDEMIDKFAGEQSGDEDEDFEGIMINLSDNEIEEDSQDDGEGDGLDDLEDLEGDDDDEEEFVGIEDQDRCNDVSASILIDDQPVELYKIEVSGNKASCYIEAVEGKEFKTQGKMLKSLYPYSVAFFTSVDGTEMGSVYIRRPESRGVFDGPYTGATTRQALVFSKINLTDDAAVASNDEQFVKNLGTIKIAVDERSKKANVSHQVGLGASTAVPPRSTVSVNYLDTPSRPYTVFEFKYRSRALLELDDIVKPRVPVNNASPPSTPAKPTITKKRKSSTNYTVDKDGAIVISDSDDEGGAIKEERRNKVKKEKGKGKDVKKEKEVIELD
ncbi:hypothetical protein JCM11491_004540 [Sporobolomyces phaffii]